MRDRPEDSIAAEDFGGDESAAPGGEAAGRSGGPGPVRRGGRPAPRKSEKPEERERVQLHLPKSLLVRLDVHCSIERSKPNDVVAKVLLAWLRQRGKGQSLFTEDDPAEAEEPPVAAKAPPTAFAAKGDELMARARASRSVAS